MTPALAAPPAPETLDHTRPLTASGNLARRLLISRIAEGAARTAALVAVAVLGVVVWSVLSRGAAALSLDFLMKDLPPSGVPGGGIGPAIVGTATIVAAATLIAAPLGILLAFFMTEFGGRRAVRAVRVALDLLNGVPSIVVALFIFGLLVVGHGPSGFAASVALAIIMLPLIARSTEEILKLVPSSLSDAADALGVERWRTVIGVILPTAAGGILTGTVLAVARAAGETAPVLVLCGIFGNSTTFNFFGEGIPNIPVVIFNASEAADPNGFTRAWGAAFVLLAFIMVSGLVARALLARSRDKLAG